jgi:serine/threonine protein phosphatase PrpC
VVFGRVMGSLTLSRAFGNRAFKRPYNKAQADFVTALPSISHHLLQPREFILVATQSFWQVVSANQAVSISAREKATGVGPQRLSQLLVQTAVDRGCVENLTVIVIYQHAFAHSG